MKFTVWSKKDVVKSSNLDPIIKIFLPISVYKCGAQVTVRGLRPYLYFKI